MKRHSNMNELQHGKQPRLYKKEIAHQNNQQLKTKSIYSSSYTSLNSYLKEFNLSEKDFFELQCALKTIFHYLKPKFISNDKQRLTSPYLQERINNNNRLLFPLYTNEYFIRNGLLNHNDGPEIYDHPFQSKYIKSSSSENILSPLVLLSNQKYLFNALTSNFLSEKSRHSNTEFKYHKKCEGEDIETKSMINRRNKVKTWERENILQQRMSITYSSIQQSETSSSIIQTLSTNKDKKISEKSFVENNISLRTYNKEEGKNIDDLFPMVKVLGRK